MAASIFAKGTMLALVIMSIAATSVDAAVFFPEQNQLVFQSQVMPAMQATGSIVHLGRHLAQNGTAVDCTDPANGGPGWLPCSTGCMPPSSICCGSTKKYCAATEKCTADGSGCCTANQVLCGNSCMPSGNVCCGRSNGDSCPSATPKCNADGKTCNGVGAAIKAHLGAVASSLVLAVVVMIMM